MESQQDRLARKIAALQVKVDASKRELAARKGSDGFRWGNTKLPDGSTEKVVTKPPLVKYSVVADGLSIRYFFHLGEPHAT